MRRTKRQTLTEREQIALTWVRSNDRHWRKSNSRTVAEHMASIPDWMNRPYFCGRAKREYWLRWLSWYFFPTGNDWMNVNYAIVRRLLRQGRA